MYKKILTTFLILFKSKLILKKPNYTNVVFIGKPSFHNDLFSKKNFGNLIANQNNTIAIWGEYYNLQILFKCFLKFKFSIIDYCQEYIDYVKPKVVITFLDNNDIIYKLKLNKIEKIVIQSAYRYEINMLNFKNEKIDKNSIDHLFVFNKSIKKLYKKVLNIKVNETGSFLLNELCPFKKSKISYKYLFISSYRRINKNNLPAIKTFHIKFQNKQKKLIKLLYDYMVKKNEKLFILGGNKYSYKEELNYYKTILPKNKYWQLIKQPKERHYSFSYKCVNKSKNIIGTNSTLLYEALSLGKKAIFFDYNFAWPLKIKKEGFFWTSKLNERKIFSLLDKIDKTNPIKWNKILRKYNYLYSSDKGNKKFRKLLSTLI